MVAKPGVAGVRARLFLLKRFGVVAEGVTKLEADRCRSILGVVHFRALWAVMSSKSLGGGLFRSNSAGAFSMMKATASAYRPWFTWNKMEHQSNYLLTKFHIGFDDLLLQYNVSAGSGN